MKKHIINFTLITMIMTLTACSNSPSDSEVKTAFLNQKQYTGCKYTTLDDFKRTNGIKGDTDKDYRVAYKATVTIHKSVLDEFKDAVSDAIKESKSNEEKLNALQKQTDLDESAERNIITNEYFNSNKSASDYSNQQDKLDALKSKYTELNNKWGKDYSNNVSTVRAALSEISQKASEKLSSGCTNTTRFNANVNDINAAKDETFIFSADQNFIKTDNGWMLNL